VRTIPESNPLRARFQACFNAWLHRNARSAIRVQFNLSASEQNEFFASHNLHDAAMQHHAQHFRFAALFRSKSLWSYTAARSRRVSAAQEVRNCEGPCEMVSDGLHVSRL
jgi:hypothetical protein